MRWRASKHTTILAFAVAFPFHNYVSARTIFSGLASGCALADRVLVAGAYYREVPVLNQAYTLVTLGVHRAAADHAFLCEQGQVVQRKSSVGFPTNGPYTAGNTAEERVNPT